MQTPDEDRSPQNSRARSILTMPRWRTARYGAALLATSAALMFLWPGLWVNLLAYDGFMTHEECYLKVPSLVRLHFLSDLFIGLFYVTISFTLAYLVHRARRDIPFHWVFIAFGLFIIACGSTHFMEVWTTFREPVYWLAGYVKLITAIASVATALVLPPLIPKTLALVQSAKLSEERRSELEAVNVKLEAEKTCASASGSFALWPILSRSLSGWPSRMATSSGITRDGTTTRGRRLSRWRDGAGSRYTTPRRCRKCLSGGG